VSKSKAKGTLAETAVAKYLLGHGWPSCERRALRGTLDQGDITGTPGVCWEIKYAGGAIKMSEWMGETEAETINARAAIGVLVVKPPGVGLTRVDRWLTAMTPKQHDELCLASALDIAFSAPVSYNSTRVQAQLELIKNESPTALAVAQGIPPSMKEFPMTWYRVMHLGELVTLLHSAGYGDEVTGGVSLDQTSE
jgi:hypothetical protein